MLKEALQTMFDTGLPAIVYEELTGDEYRPVDGCLLYTSPSPRDLSTSRMPSSA